MRHQSLEGNDQLPPQVPVWAKIREVQALGSVIMMVLDLPVTSPCAVWAGARPAPVAEGCGGSASDIELLNGLIAIARRGLLVPGGGLCEPMSDPRGVAAGISETRASHIGETSRLSAKVYDSIQRLRVTSHGGGGCG